MPRPTPRKTKAEHGTPSQERLSYYYVESHGQTTVYATRRPRALEVALDRAYGCAKDVEFGRLSYRAAHELGAWANPTSTTRRATSAQKQIAQAERAADGLIADFANDTDPCLSDLVNVAAEVVAATCALDAATTQRSEVIRAARLAGRTLAEISQITGLSRQRISQISEGAQSS